MLRVGINLWFKDRPRIRELLSRARAAGFSYVELSMDYPFGVVDREPFEEMLRIARDEGFEVAVHAPWQEVNIASPLEPVRRGSVEVVKAAIEEASRLGALYVVTHVTSCQAVCKKEPPSTNPCVAAAIRSLRELLSYAERLGVELYPENTGGACCGKIDQFSTVVEEAGALACLDAAHALTSDSQLVKRLPQPVELAEVVDEWSSALNNRVALLHIHGVRRRSDGHVESHTDFDQCTVDVKRIVRRLGGSLRYVLFEIFRHSNGTPFDPLRVAHLAKDFRSWSMVYCP